MQTQEAKVFIFGDGDDIRHKVENYLFSADIASLSSFSQKLTATLNNIRKMLIEKFDAEIIVAGGDDIIFALEQENYKEQVIVKVQDYFNKQLGCTISFGIGENIENAYLNLLKAKAAGKNKIVDSRLDSNIG